MLVEFNKKIFNKVVKDKNSSNMPPLKKLVINSSPLKDIKIQQNNRKSLKKTFYDQWKYNRNHL